MTNLPAYLALHGVIVLVASFVAGLLLHRAIRLQKPGAEAWHLAHAGVAKLVAALWLFFVWTSTAAMLIAAATGHRGLTWHGSAADRTVFGLYVAGTVVVFPAALLLIAGLIRAL